MRWLNYVDHDPDWRSLYNAAAVNDENHSSPINFNLPFESMSKEQRLGYLKIMSQLFSQMTAAQCAGIFQPSSDFRLQLPRMSTFQLEQFLSLINATVRTAVHPIQPVEHYSTEQLLEADSYMETTLTDLLLRQKKFHDWAKQDLKNQAPPLNSTCQVTNLIFKAIRGAPEPYRSEATWDLLSNAHSDHDADTLDSVVRHAEQYALETFDTPSLPTTIREQLPVNDSRPLPFKELLIQGNWINRTSQNPSTPYLTINLNTRNNGILVQILRSMDGLHAYKWVTFATNLGYQTLKHQVVGTGSRVHPPTLVPISMPLLLANAVPQPNSHYELPETQPSPNHIKFDRCETEEAFPASRIFPTLSGKAVEISCQAVTDKGTGSQWRDAYLYDYGIAVMLFSIDDDGLTTAEINSVTVLH